MLGFLISLAVSLESSCASCVEDAQKIKDMLAGGVKGSEIRINMEKMCAKLNGIAKEDCDSYLKLPLDIIVSALQNDASLTAGQVCTKLEFCLRQKKESTANSPERSANGPSFSRETRPDWSVSWSESL